MKLDHESIERLRAQLLNRGVPSIRPREFSTANAEGRASYHRVRPLAEAMYLVLAARGPLSDAAKQLIRGALRTLTGDELGTQATATLLDDAAENLRREGLESRLDRIGALLWADKRDRQLTLALVLAGAVAADGTLTHAQQDAFVSLATRIGVQETAARTMLDEADPDKLKETLIQRAD